MTGSIDPTNVEIDPHNYELDYEFEADGIRYQRLRCVDPGCGHISDGWWRVKKEELW